MDYIFIFEEFRFIMELLVAELILAEAFAKKRQEHARRTIVGFIIMLLIGVSFAWTHEDIYNFGFQFHMGEMLTCFWYVLLSLLSYVYLKLCYVITWSDVLFLGICGYAVQHMEYIAVNEVLARGIWTNLQEELWLYFIVCVLTCGLWYWFVMKIFSKALKECGGLIYEDKWKTVLYFLIMLLVVYCSSFLCQGIFVNRSSDYSNVNYLGAASDFFSCLLIFVAQYSVCRISSLTREREIIKQLLYERQKQYQLSKENIDIINRKCHDLKHQIQAIKMADAEDIRQYMEEVEASIMIYDHVLETDNEVLNTILSEKSLYCERHQIKLTCIVDGAPLDFISTMDMYALLGNALDNAIEAVSKCRNIEKRIVSLTISAKDSFLSIQINNYYEGEIKFCDGLPISTKRRNRAYHGFGMKSIRHLTEKYGGTLVTDLEDDVFTLQIILPMPKEFIRLLKEKKNQEICQ